MFAVNSLFLADAYKYSHFVQYPANTEYVLSNFTPRSSRLANIRSFEGKDIDGVINFGVQMMLMFITEHFEQNFFLKSKEEAITAFKAELDLALVTDYDVSHFEALWELGYLPIRVRALPEGAFVPSKVPTFTVEPTMKEFYWVGQFLETLLSNEAWKPATVATLAFRFRRILEAYAKKTGSSMEFVDFQGHDFSARGLGNSSEMAKSAIGHAIVFAGSDTFAVIPAARHYYKAEGFVVGSVPATEHSVMCAGGMEDEIETFRRLIQDIYPTGVVSIVSDTWHLWNVIGKGGIAEQLKDAILARQPNVLGLAKTVFRPDSGDPAAIVCGYNYMEVEDLNDYATILDVADECCEAILYKGKYYIYDVEYDRYGDVEGIKLLKELSESEVKGAVECLWDIFGGTTTETGHKLLDSHVGVIYGDSITIDRLEEILRRLEAKGFASGNMVFGVGSFTYQYNTRDTYGFAMKATYTEVDGTGRELFKDPITDGGVKKSAKGLLRVVKDARDEYKLIDQCVMEEMTTPFHNLMDVVYENGMLVAPITFAEIKNNVRKELDKRALAI